MLLFEIPGGTEWVIVIIALFLSFLLIIPKIFYLLTLQSTFQAISVKNRKMNPGEVWLLLIPVFDLIWNFIIVSRLADSLKAELDSRNLPQTETRPAYDIGLVMSILRICFQLGGFVCWIIYWVKINNYKKRILNIQKQTAMAEAPSDIS